MSFVGLLGDWLRKINTSITTISINGPTVTCNKHDGTSDTETINLDAIYSKRKGTLVDNSILRESGSGLTGGIQNGIGSDASEIIDVGWDVANGEGAFLGLRSVNCVTDSGSFRLGAKNPNEYVILRGFPDGRLTWNESNVITENDPKSLGTFNRMYFSQTSGNFIAPRTGVYRITLKGGGGGGGGRNTNHTYTGGSGGGEGGTLIFYVTLTKSQSYAYTIGAGGTAGSNGAGTQTDGGGGGATKFTVSGTVSYQSNGGSGGANSGNLTKPGGRGGSTYSVPSGAVCHFIPGAPGMPGAGVGSGASLTDYPFYAAMGGGNGGGCAASGQLATYGGGGAGSSGASGYPPAAQDGGNGYILIEYAG